MPISRKFIHFANFFPFFSKILMKGKYETFQNYEMAFYLHLTNNGEFSAQQAAGGTISQN